MRYIAFLRGINVGGRNAVRMDSLREMFTDLGFDGIRTYIQSGNIVFESTDVPAADVISGKFRETFGFSTDIVIRSHAEISDMFSRMPFHDGADDAKAFVFMSNDPIDLSGIPDPDGSIVRADGRDVFVFCINGLRDSKTAGRISGSASVTFRNLRTMRRLKGMLDDGC